MQLRSMAIFKNLSVRGRLGFMAGALIVLLLSIGLVGLFEMAASQGRTVESVESGDLSMRSVDSARTAQVAFKKQVQEWKDTLLRGFDRQDFDRYLGNFGKQEAEVQKELSSLKTLMQRQQLSVK